jgi:hypothetical protein
VCGLNDRARRNVVKEFLPQERLTLVCIQETKLSSLCNALANEILGATFDYDFLPSIGAAGGILLAWSHDRWMVSDIARGCYTLSGHGMETGASSAPWWISVVYGPQLDADKIEFLDELLQFRDASPGPWFLCGDFNMIYRAQDKNNGRLDRRCMRRFRALLNRAHLDEIDMIGRRFTWSNERGQPPLELLDRMFATSDWLAAFPNHILKPLSSDYSDHCPLLLQLQAFGAAKRRFRFEPFWVKILGFTEVVANAWARILPHADPFGYWIISCTVPPRRCSDGVVPRLAAFGCSSHLPVKLFSYSMRSKNEGR